jgi:hypothetical protein
MSWLQKSFFILCMELSLSMYIIIKKLGIRFSLTHVRLYCDFIKIFLIFHIFSQFSSVFSKSFHYSTFLSSIFSISFHISTYPSAIFYLTFHNYPYFFPSIFFISVYFVGFVSFRFHFVDFVSFRFRWFRFCRA